MKKAQPGQVLQTDLDNGIVLEEDGLERGENDIETMSNYSLVIALSYLLKPQVNMLLLSF